MSAMQTQPRETAPRASTFSLVVTLLAVWGILGTAGYFYSKQQHIPAAVAAPVLLAFLIEAGLWVAMGLRCAREWISENRPVAWLIGAGVVPYLVYSVGTGVFRPASLATIAALVAAASLWFVLLPKHPLTDLGFLAVIACVVLGHWLAPLYPPPAVRPKLDVLGDLMWRRTAILAVLTIRGAGRLNFGFFPGPRDWRIGGLAFLGFLPIGVALSLVTGFARFQPQSGPWWKLAAVAAGTFVGMLWVVALFEEFFFRGLLQNWLAAWTSSAIGGLVTASLLFGLAHLPFRQFPNWRFAALAAVAGLFYGWAYDRTGSIRAAMVTHALVNTTWRMLFG